MTRGRRGRPGALRRRRGGPARTRLGRAHRGGRRGARSATSTTTAPRARARSSCAPTRPRASSSAASAVPVDEDGWFATGDVGRHATTASSTSPAGCRRRSSSAGSTCTPPRSRTSPGVRHSCTMPSWSGSPTSGSGEIPVAGIVWAGAPDEAALLEETARRPRALQGAARALLARRAFRSRHATRSTAGAPGARPRRTGCRERGQRLTTTSLRCTELASTLLAPWTTDRSGTPASRSASSALGP